MPPAARLTDKHFCPMTNQIDLTPIPHVGGQIIGPGASNVLIGGLPASVLGDKCFCVGSHDDTIVKGSSTVLICGKPAVRMGDACLHGGYVLQGCPTVRIGG
jgi:uncharacterized Zn-binding protein involved in type VI secretion